MTSRTILLLALSIVAIRGMGQSIPEQHSLESIQSAIQSRQFDEALRSVDLQLKESPNDVGF